MQIQKFVDKNKQLILVFLLCFVVAVYNYTFLSILKQLPSPIFGGDFYNHLGYIYHLFYGGSVFENGQLTGEMPWVPWLYHLYVLIFSFITNLDPLFGLIYSSLPIIFLSGITVFCYLRKISANTFLLLAAILIFLKFYPIYKYTDFAMVVMVPLLILAWLKYLDDANKKYTAFLIFIITLSNLTNTQLFFVQIILFGVILLDKFFTIYKKQNCRTFADITIHLPEFWNMLKPFAFIFFFSLLFSMLYWYWPFFVYKMETPNPLQIYGWADFSDIGTQISYPINVFISWYFSSSLLFSILGLIQIGGMVLLFQKRNENPTYRFFFLLMLAAFIGLFHYLITFNLLHKHVAPEKLFQLLAYSLMPVLFVIFAQWATHKISFKYLPIFLLIFAVFLYADTFNSMINSQYVKGAGKSFDPAFIELKTWIINNTNVNDVILTTNEDAFMMNALTGRKSVVYRRTHIPTFTNINQRMLDQAVILQGNNDSLRYELLKKYEVKYVLWSAFWFSNEVLLDENMKITRLFDPLMVQQKPEYKRYMDENRIFYLQYYTYLDPAWVSNYPRYFVYIIPPIQNEYKPWVPDLDKKLTPIKRINAGEQPLFIIYEVNYNDEQN